MKTKKILVKISGTWIYSNSYWNTDKKGTNQLLKYLKELYKTKPTNLTMKVNIETVETV